MVYNLTVWFEHGGDFLWASDSSTRDYFGCCYVDVMTLPVSDETKELAEFLQAEYRSAFDWNDFSKGCIWSKEEIEKFGEKVKDLVSRMRKELGEAYCFTLDLGRSF